MSLVMRRNPLALYYDVVILDLCREPRSSQRVIYDPLKSDPSFGAEDRRVVIAELKARDLLGERDGYYFATRHGLRVLDSWNEMNQFFV